MQTKAEIDRAALLSGIEKWERNALATTPLDAQIYGDSCELCSIYSDDWCHGCPVKAKTGMDQCANSPWQTASDALINWDIQLKNKSDKELQDAFQAAARAEVDFLRGLLAEMQE